MDPSPPDRPGSLNEVLERARRLGFLGDGPVDAHVEHARRLVRALSPDTPRCCADLGSGGGVPGLILAMAWPSSRWSLIDAMSRRTGPLAEAVSALDLGARVDVVTARVEDLGRRQEHRGVHDLVVARSFGSPAVTAECAAPLVAGGGVVAVSEPPEVDARRWPASALAELGLVDEGRHDGWRLLRAGRPCPERWPRRSGRPAKRPLW